MPTELLTVSEAARALKCSDSYLNKLRTTGGGPCFVRVGRSIRYREVDLSAWVAARAASSTSAYAQGAA